MTIKKIQSEYPDLDKYIKEYDGYEYENDDGDIFYCKKDTDIAHNPYGPAYIGSDGYKSYMINNLCHRLDGPGVIWENGDEHYYINGKAIGNSKQQFYNNIKNLNAETINEEDKINVLNIKNSLSNGLDIISFNILKYLI